MKKTKAGKNNVSQLLGTGPCVPSKAPANYDPENEPDDLGPTLPTQSFDVPNPIPNNPVFSVLRRGVQSRMREKRKRLFLSRCNDLPPKVADEICGADTIRELGLLLFNAMTAGDIAFGEVVKTAAKRAECIFLNEKDADWFNRFTQFICKMKPSPSTRTQLEREFKQWLVKQNITAWMNGKQWKRIVGATNFRYLRAEKPGPKPRARSSKP